MNLKDFFAQKENPPELFWSLVLEESFVQAGVWYINNGIAEVIALSSPTPWEGDDGLLQSVDATLSSCIQKLPEEFQEATKTVFGVPSSWSVNGEIKEEYLEKIKRLCSELSLTPTGFVVLPEAFAHLFKSEEGSPINGIILGLGKSNLEISIFKLGNLIGSATVARSVSLVDDVVEGLSRFKESGPFPSRIIVFNGKEGEVNEAKDELNKVNWEEKDQKEGTSGIKFLHTPKVEILDFEKKVLAVSLAGASEIANVSKVESKPNETISSVDENVQKVDTLSASDLGFVVGEDINKPPQVNPIPLPQETESRFNFDTNIYLDKIKGFLGRFKTPTGGKKLTPLLTILGVILVGFLALWWFYPKATVSIYVSPKKYEGEFQMNFGSGELQNVSVSGEKTKSATGSKKVGESAKGSIQIRNGTATAINLSAGTNIISSGDLSFSLDSSASVSAALSPSSPGTATVNVTASAIGAEYNLAKDEIFKVGNYPKADVDAVSLSDFSGGSSRDISAVSKEDQEKLLSDLTRELEEKAKKELKLNASENEIVIDDFVEVETVDEVYSHKVGDEADNVKLSMRLDIKAVVTDRTKLAEKVREEISDKIPEGYVLRDTQITYKFTFEEETNDGYQFSVSIEANFLPEIKQDEIIKKILGKTPENVENYLTTISGYTRAEIRLKPRFPGPFGTLPRVAKNINIEVIAEQ